MCICTHQKASRSSGKERDAESGLDYFGARYYGSNMGRWMSPDWAAKPEAVPYSELASPQTLNLYAYAGNNPLRQADVDGHLYGDKNSGPTGVDSLDNEYYHEVNEADYLLDHGATEVTGGSNSGGSGGGQSAQQQSSTQKWEAQNEAKTKASIASYPTAPASARMTLTGCENKSCNYTLTGVSGTFYVYEHFANDGVAGSKPAGHGDFTTSLTGSAGGYREDQITAFGLGTLDQHRFFTISPSATYDPSKQMSVMIFEAGHSVSFEHLYNAAPNAPSYVNGIPAASYHP